MYLSIYPSIHLSIHLSWFLFVSSIHCRTPTIQRSTFLWVHTNNLLVYFSSIRLSSYSTCVSAPSISRPVHVSGLISLSIQALFVHPVVYPITSNNPEPGGAKVADQGESIPTVTHLRPGTLPCKTFPKPALITNWGSKKGPVRSQLVRLAFLTNKRGKGSTVGFNAQELYFFLRFQKPG